MYMCAYKIYACLQAHVQGIIGEQAKFVLYMHAGTEGKLANMHMYFCRLFPN